MSGQSVIADRTGGYMSFEDKQLVVTFRNAGELGGKLGMNYIILTVTEKEGQTTEFFVSLPLKMD